MHYTIFRCVALMFLCAALISTFVIHSSRAQEKQRRGEFGSSLKRLKWDEREQKAVETKKGDKRTDSGAVISQQLALAGVAKLTGGWEEYLEEPEQAAGIYDRIFAGIERRYILTYYPTNTKRDGRLRRVEIKVRNHPEYVIWGKKAYYADSQ